MLFIAFESAPFFLCLEVKMTTVQYKFLITYFSVRIVLHNVFGY